MYEHAYHMDFGANAKAYVDTFLRNVDWPALQVRYEDAAKVPGPRPLQQPEFGDVPGIGQAGFDAKYMNSGQSGWKAIGAPMRLRR
ncbi:MAG TPA: Fe-Mn family superoxide dismutase [Casimicrobiaceae bacterium]|nr:Fe-Mn family superoxide dismutase [Casimicrobiaceae bacterium]